MDQLFLLANTDTYIISCKYRCNTTSLANTVQHLLQIQIRYNVSCKYKYGTMSNKEQRICKATANTITANIKLCKRAFLVKMKNNANTMTKVATSLDLHRIQLLPRIATVL